MTPAQIVGGRLNPDGTLELQEKVQLPPGPVEVTVRAVSLPAPPVEDWWQYLQRARLELESLGHRFRTQEEIAADRTAFRDE